MPNPSFTDIIKAYLEAQFGGDVPPIPGVTIDDELSTTSENPVQNKVITAALALKAAITDIPTKLSQLLNDSGYQTAAQVQTAISTAVPTKTSDLTNDSGFQTAAQVQAAVNGKADKFLRIAMTASDTTAALNSNTFYVFPEMATLTPTLAPPTDNTIVNEYHFVFDSGSTATVLTLPASVLQPDGFTVEANMHYEISILEGAMTAQGWAVTA